MKKIKRIFTGLLIFLIVLSVAVIIYVVQFGEEPVGVSPPPVEKKGRQPPKALVPKQPLEKLVKEKPVKETPKETVAEKPVRQKPDLGKPAVQKEKIVVSKIGKIPLPQRHVAIIIDDIGYDLAPLRELLKIDADITFAILPLLSYTESAAEMLHKAGRETLLHLPMEPLAYPKEKPGNGALFTDMNDAELISQLEKDLASVPHISGVNNHMGSKFMADEEKLVLVFKQLKKNNLFFIDSRTTTDTQTLAAARKTHVRVGSRKIFLDHHRDYNQIYKILMDMANNKDNGAAVIMIGHPYPETIRALRDAHKVFREKGINVVPVSKLINSKESGGAS